MTIATLDTMSDTELDQRLARLYRQHLAASQAQRGGWHDMIVEVLEEQRVRRDAALGISHEPALHA